MSTSCEPCVALLASQCKLQAAPAPCMQLTIAAPLLTRGLALLMAWHFLPCLTCLGPFQIPFSSSSRCLDQEFYHGTTSLSHRDFSHGCFP